MGCARISHTASRHALAEDEMILSDAIRTPAARRTPSPKAHQPSPGAMALFPQLTDSSLNDRIQEEIKTVINEVITPVDVKQEAIFDSLSPDGARAADGGG